MCTGANTTGCNIAINYANSTERAEKFSKELSSKYPNVKIVVIQADVGQKAACEKLITETISQLGGLDVIISNAGILALM
jgi:3-oxoacyl-[acyl-carrier protein] reductase